jgi:hypothetical protein
MLTISWASHGYFDIFQDDSIQDNTVSGVQLLSIDAGELATPYGATPNTEY